MKNKYLIRYSLWNIEHNDNLKTLKESKYDNFESEVYDIYEPIILKEGKLPDATILIFSDKDINTICNEIQTKFEEKYGIKRLVIVEYVNDIVGFSND
jgi:hypothetical protein